MAFKIKDLTDRKFGRLKAIRREGSKNGSAAWLCHCDCGEHKIIRGDVLTSGLSNSCGCLRKELGLKHGMSHTRFYKIWAGILKRCNNPKSHAYEDYGGRGITVCERWSAFELFKEDMLGAYQEHASLYGEYKTTIERVDNDSGYSPGNCIWATPKVQSNNRRRRRRTEAVANG